MKFERYVSLDLETLIPLQSVELARDLLQLLASYGPEFTPKRMGLTEPLRQKFDLSKAIEIWMNDDNSSIMFEADPYETSIVVTWSINPARPFSSIGISIDESYFQSEENAQKFIDLAKSLYSFLSAVYGNSMHHNDWEAKAYVDMVGPNGKVIGKESVGGTPDWGLVDVYWANFLGPAYVDLFGEERLLTAPCERCERLPDGGFMILTSASPLLYDRPEITEIERALKDHLDNDAFFDRSNPEKKLRAPRFPQPQRPEKVEFRWREEPVSRREREAALRWIEENEVYAKAFVEKMRRRGVKLDYSEESLDLVDRYVLESRRRGDQLNDEDLLEIGAYVAQTVIRNLGGEWSFKEEFGEPCLTTQGTGTFPRNKVWKLWKFGEGDCVAYWYDVLKSGLLQSPR